MRGKKYRIMILLTLFMFTDSIIITNTSAENITSEKNFKHAITVAKNGKGDYTSIQAAIDGTPAGSVIYIETGSYNETINIKKEVTLIGEDKNHTIINPISEKNKYAIRLGAPEVTIRNLSITNGAPGLYTTGIHVSASKTKIYNCNIYKTPVGIAIWSSDNIINGCSFSDCNDEGVVFIGSSYSKCENNSVINCVFYRNCDGIELQHSGNNTITNCRFYENTHSGIDAIASSNDNNTISKCKIYNNEVHGIYLSASSDNKILDCSISNNTDGNIIMDKNSLNNEIKPAVNSDLDNSQISHIFTYDTQAYNRNSKELHEKSIIERIYSIISSLVLPLVKIVK